MRRKRLWGLAGALLVLAALAAVGWRWGLPLLSNTQSNSLSPIRLWFTDPASRPGLTTTMNRQTCPGAPFILPSDGFIGLLWADPAGPYTVFSRHTGIDIFGDSAPGQVPVYAAYDGWLTRLPDWLSSVIIRHDDPLQPGRIIWTYYTHMAARDGRVSFVAPEFPAGTSEQPVTQGTLLGYQGEFAGFGRPAIGLHLHFSIVLSDEDGRFLNETVLANTLDPSPYLGMALDLDQWPERPIRCRAS